MKVKRKTTIKLIIVCLAGLLAFLFFTGIGDLGGKKSAYKTTEKAGEAYRLFINNINMPMNREGVMANVAIDGPEGGKLDGKEFLFSGGFFLSGKTGNTTWANAVASASRIQDYEPGNYATGKTDARAQLYVLRQKDGDFAPSWEDWRDAVALGAYFYDGDGDGEYNPVDLNGNGKWDPESFPGAGDGEDRPDLLGDETVWCVYHDNVDPALRSFNNIDPQGIEIRQTVFAFASKGVTGNMIFLRYSIMNTGLKADVIDSVYFGVWADPDLGNLNDAYLDDLVGCDTTINAGFTYNSGDDNEWGPNPPCFIIDFFQGPISYIPGETFIDNDGDGKYTDGVDTPLDTATNVQGQARGIAEFPGAKNLGLSSFVHYMQSHPQVGDPAFASEARNYMLGLDKNGNPLNPSSWTFGQVRGGVNPADVNNKFWYSGDPVTDVGWINIFETDQRQMSNTGPFQLVKDQPVDIVVAYVVATGNGPLDAITVAKEYDLTAQLIFDSNFPSPPAPPAVSPSVQNGSNFIDINFDTYQQVPYNIVDDVLDIDRKFQGYYITAFRTNSKAGTVGGVTNTKVIAEYQLDNFIENIYKVAGNGGQDLIFKDVSPEFKLDSLFYSDPTSGRIRFRLYSDPFTGLPFIKGHEYYFAVTHYYLNHRVVVNRETGIYGPPGDYLDPSGSAIEEFETPIIIATFGEDQLNPATYGMTANQFSGASDGEIKQLTVNAEALTGDEYTVEFFKDNSITAGQDYSLFWRLKNNRTSAVLIDSSTVYDFDTTNYAGDVIEGFILKVKSVDANIGSSMYTPADNRWFTTFRTDSSTGVYYVGRDIPQGRSVTVGSNSSARSNYIRADNLRKVELRFGESGKAYRYLNGFVGTAITRRASFVYAEAVTPADTGGTKGSVGNWDTAKDRANGWVDVPFTAWMVDEGYFKIDGVTEPYQLAVGFIEISKDLSGNADGNWDPGTIQTALGNEIIAIFDAPYDPTGSQIEYTGNAAGWADILRSYTLDDPNATQSQVEIAASQWLNTMYAVSLKKYTDSSFYQVNDKLIIPISEYPYTESDIFSFKTIAGGELTFDEQKQLFDKVNVYPNPLFGYNPGTSYTNSNPDDVFVTFSNLPEEISIKIYTLSGSLLRTLSTADKSNPSSNFLRWDLKNQDDLRVASGLYLAIVSSPKFGDKILKFSIIMPQKQIQRF